jgi:DNA replicative helicase MCM subunit Mcm2 (Cdc46/Mcm family)
MSDIKYNSQIEKIASAILEDKISLDEQDENKLKKYIDLAKKQFNLQDESAAQIVNEAFLYLKLKGADSADPLQHGDQFGAGFS